MHGSNHEVCFLYSVGELIALGWIYVSGLQSVRGVCYCWYLLMCNKFNFLLHLTSAARKFTLSLMRREQHWDVQQTALM